MTEEPNPFPTVDRLAKECGTEWPHFHQAALETARIERIFKEAIQEEALKAEVPRGRVLDTDSSLVLFGSFARHEMVPGSDCDWTLLINGVVNNRHADDARLIQRAIKNAAGNGKGLKDPGPGGAFGNLCFSHDLVHKIGGGADSNENLTRRILMLLESRAVSLSAADSAAEVWQAVVRSILERYFEEDVHFSIGKKVPRFLLNDLTRYWRTICVDYAAKHEEQDGAKWAIRNAKLRLSRKLLYAAGLAFCFRCQLSPPAGGIEGEARSSEPFIAAAMKFAATPPLEFLAVFIDDFVKGENRPLASTSIFGAYDEWLELLGDNVRRSRLEGLSHSSARGDDTFQQVRKIGRQFSKGLKVLFFGRDHDENEISDLSLEYVGF
jgi:predicted nucleotidyltransferase